MKIINYFVKTTNNDGPATRNDIVNDADVK